MDTGTIVTSIIGSSVVSGVITAVLNHRAQQKKAADDIFREMLAVSHRLRTAQQDVVADFQRGDKPTTDASRKVMIEIKDQFRALAQYVMITDPIRDRRLCAREMYDAAFFAPPAPKVDPTKEDRSFIDDDDDPWQSVINGVLLGMERMNRAVEKLYPKGDGKRFKEWRE